MPIEEAVSKNLQVVGIDQENQPISNLSQEQQQIEQINPLDNEKLEAISHEITNFAAAVKSEIEETTTTSSTKASVNESINKLVDDEEIEKQSVGVVVVENLFIPNGKHFLLF